MNLLLRPTSAAQAALLDMPPPAPRRDPPSSFKKNRFYVYGPLPLCPCLCRGLPGKSKGNFRGKATLKGG